MKCAIGIVTYQPDISRLAENLQAALASTMEGDTTNFYISRKLKHTGVRISVIARGISVGDELEYTDEVTLGRAIINRTAIDK